ncbi:HYDROXYPYRUVATE REDUCTASE OXIDOREDUCTASE PROTEIN; tartrate degradation [Cupriavidus taiwanensis]|uniref:HYDROXYPYRUVATE REDUCTASE OXIDOREDUCTASE PROTEIN tartrate degradation n=1 Tax=Cupriavidus taiwanensis TaxID=164546 RepID=A0A976AXV3_9BURK|nr:glycerate kinase [Cupriavidus taiwanensis]SOZ58502.1 HYDROXYPYRUVATE REDUCTASE OXIDOREDUCTASE PROTEIN; tartrate degradation [Cupriavidus taiwanensis]SOZ59406.1 HYDROXYPYRUVATE REDUCTASE OXIDOREDUCTASE PROTEIN; tartrate degradation [Cupriavidus taiwanensis]SOZ62569.1 HYDROXYPYRUVATE REDUCTASE OXIDOREDUCTASE PROTEIN; tartrate degradation [Cupriavidus taiwanensis]SPA06228.1 HYDROXYPYRUVATE REDUCTASE OXIDOREDUCTASE PROTEIN; tartrate degradation [Cupriavidus taiwanensis]
MLVTEPQAALLSPQRTAANAEPRALLRDLFDTAVASVSASHCLPPHLPAPPKGRTVVIGAGKAAAAMAQAVEANWQGELSGLVVTRYGHGADCKRIEVVEAAHPVPDEAGARAAQRMVELVQGLSADDLVLCLISGGGSALLAAPAPGLTLADKQAVNKALLRSGASIGEMNCVRKHLSALKGGRLALHCAPARVETLLISDIPGDDPTLIASGPTLPDATTCADALAVIAKYGIEVPANVRAHLESGAGETPKPGDARFNGHRSVTLATAQQALEAAAARARELGFEAHILSDCIEGEAREVAEVHAAIARQVAQRGQPFGKPCVILSGGETTVTVRGKGRGGRNAEFLLALAVALDGLPGVHALAGDTDGIDGSEDNAGALLSPDTLTRAGARGLQARAHLENNDGYGFFAGLDDLIVTGPTRTNVNDFRAILIV